MMEAIDTNNATLPLSFFLERKNLLVQHTLNLPCNLFSSKNGGGGARGRNLQLVFPNTNLVNFSTHSEKSMYR